MNEVLTPILAQLTRGIELSADAVDAALGELFEGRVSDVQAAAFIVALRTKGETEDELAAIIRTWRRYGTPVDVPDGAIDTCGTGGDRSGSINVSTMAALVAAGAGARVVKHGNRAASSQAGSADVLEELGVMIELGPGGCRAVRRRGRGRFLLRAPLQPRDAFPRPGAQGDRRADDVQLPRPARQSRSSSPPGGRRVRRRDGNAACWARSARSAPSARWCSTAATASTS